MRDNNAVMDTTISAGKSTLKDLELIIEQGLPDFRRVGAALAEVRSRHLYRPDYRSFVHYLKERWDLGKSHAYRTMDAAGIAEALDPGGDLWDSPSAIEEFAREAGYTSTADARKALEKMTPEQIVGMQEKVRERARAVETMSQPERLHHRFDNHLNMLRKLLPKLGFDQASEAAQLLERLEELTHGN